jgi:hypothetical protein
MKQDGQENAILLFPERNVHESWIKNLVVIFRFKKKDRDANICIRNCHLLNPRR